MVPVTGVVAALLYLALRHTRRLEGERQRAAQAAAEEISFKRQQAVLALKTAIASRLPQPAPILDYRQAEIFAGRVLEALGFEGVRVTQKTRDNGVDVEGPAVVAQVKFQQSPVSPDKVQQLVGIAFLKKKTAVFFSRGGYSRAALQVGAAGHVALFSFGDFGALDTGSQAAETLVRRLVIDLLPDAAPERPGRAPVLITSKSTTTQPPPLNSTRVLPLGSLSNSAVDTLSITGPVATTPPNRARLPRKHRQPTNVSYARRQQPAIVRQPIQCFSPGCTYFGPPGTCPTHELSA
jgi:Restriction endonuclease